MAFSVSPQCCCFSKSASSRISLILSPSLILSGAVFCSCCGFSCCCCTVAVAIGSDALVLLTASGIWSIDSCEWNVELDSCDCNSEQAGSDWMPLSWDPFSLLVLSGCLLLESCRRFQRRKKYELVIDQMVFKWIFFSRMDGYFGNVNELEKYKHHNQLQHQEWNGERLTS